MKIETYALILGHLWMSLRQKQHSNKYAWNTLKLSLV